MGTAGDDCSLSCRVCCCLLCLPSLGISISISISISITVTVTIRTFQRSLCCWIRLQHQIASGE